MRIDAHQHFWRFDPVRDSWITDDMAVIQKDFLPGDFHAVLKKNNFDGSVLVQSDQSEDENEFQLKNAEEWLQHRKNTIVLCRQANGNAASNIFKMRWISFTQDSLVLYVL